MDNRMTGLDIPDRHSLRIGTAPVNWNNFDLTDWRPVVPYPAILDEMKAAGYAGTEWDASFGAEFETLWDEISKRDMSYTGAYRWLDFLNDDAFAADMVELETFTGLLAAIGASHLIVADRMRPHRIACAGAVPTDGSQSLDDAGYAALSQNLTRLAERVSPIGIQVHYHNHVGSYIESPREVEGLVRHLQGGPVDLCFDTGHYAYGGGDALAFLNDHLDSIGYLHLKDVDGTILADARRHGWSFLDALRHIIFCPLGDGDAEIPAIVETLVLSRFDGWLIVEQDTCNGDATLNARNNLRTLLALADDGKDPEP